MNIEDMKAQINELNNRISEIKELLKTYKDLQQTQIDNLHKSMAENRAKENASGKRIAKLREVQNALEYLKIDNISIELIYTTVKQEKESIKDCQENSKAALQQIETLKHEMSCLTDKYDSDNLCPICMDNEANLNLGCCKAKYCAICVFKLEKSTVGNFIKCAVCRKFSNPCLTYIKT
jgi:DNA repair exonuclease SbcCD ATPase subunit